MKIRQTGGADSLPRPIPRERFSSEKGLTLVEVIIAAMILVVGILSFFAVFLNCIRLDDDSKESIVAINHARLWMERIRAMPYAVGDVPNYRNMSDDELAFSCILVMNDCSFDVPYLRRINSNVLPGLITVDNSNDRFADVTATITWAGRGGDRSLNLQARFSRFDPVQ